MLTVLYKVSDILRKSQAIHYKHNEAIRFCWGWNIPQAELGLFGIDFPTLYLVFICCY
jgi:hypothetical protein